MSTSNKHLFVSYSRADSKFAHQVVIDLQKAGLNVWIDVQGLEPGTPNWEQSIRDAIANSFALLLIASPDSRQSIYVQGELTVAKARKCVIYTIWANGNEWIDCVPLEMANHQYIDGRGEQYANNIIKLSETLKGLANPEGIVRLGLPTHEIVSINLTQFKRVLDAMDYIYLNYLMDWYPPLTYGVDWILANVQTKRLAVPWEWLLLSDNRINLLRMYEKSSSLGYKDFGIENNSHWAVWEVSRIRAAGIAFNDQTLMPKLLTQYSSRDLALLYADKQFKTTHPNSVKPDKYKVKIILALFGNMVSYDHAAFIQTENSQIQ